MTYRRKTRYATALAAFACLPALVSAAEPQGRDKALEGAATAKGMAEKALPRFVAHEAGSPVVDAQGETLGSLADLVLDRKSGRASLAVIELAGSTVPARRAVPYAKLSFEGEGAADARYSLPMSAEELHEQPEFHPPVPVAKGTEKAGDAQGKGAERAAKPAGMQKQKVTPEVLASELVKSDVLAQEESFGRIETLFLEPKKGTVAFLAIAPRSGAPIAAPWQALEPTQEGELRIDRAIADLTTAPTINPSEATRLRDEAFRNEIYGFYGLKSQSFPASPRN